MERGRAAPPQLWISVISVIEGETERADDIWCDSEKEVRCGYGRFRFSNWLLFSGFGEARR
jgi:hypothetical protein